MRICEPAKAYFVILVVYFIIKALFKVVTVQTFIVDLVVALFWTWILSILCRKKMKELAWAFVLLPFVIIGSSFIYGGGVFREGLDDTSAIVKSVTAEQLGVSVGDIKDSSSFVEDLGADSLDVVELILAIEEKFGIENTSDECTQLKTVNEVVNYVNYAKQK